MKITQVDAFADRIFTGNPAAVCITGEPLEETLMQSIAMEMNLSETAFLVKATDGYDLRWFTPVCEVKLCGHATLASAHVLWQDGQVSTDEIVFHTLSGDLTAKRQGGRIELNFPIRPVTKCDRPAGLAEALGVTPVFVGMSDEDLLVLVSSEEEVKTASPDFGRLAKVSARGIILTSRAERKYDFISRFFAPSFGIDEDPVTGSAHCALGAFWSEKLEKNELLAYQASARGGEVWLKVESGRVLLTGKAVTVMRAELEV